MLQILHLILTKVSKYPWLLAVIDTIIIIALCAFIIFRKPAPTIPVKDNEKEWRDSIKILSAKYDSVQVKINKLNLLNDSLVNVKTNIKIAYEKKIQYIDHAPIDTVYAFVLKELNSTK